jgi:hypothetical protein
MKGTYIFLFYFFNICFLQAQIPEWIWAKSAGSNWSDISNDIITDTNGDIYISGYAEDTIIFDSITLYSSGNFIVKYASTGQILWVKKTSYVQDPYFKPVTVTINPDNNLFIHGEYYGDTTVFGNDTLLGKGICIFKYDMEGNLIWTKSAGSANYVNGYGSVSISKITCDNTGNLYIIGNFSGISDPTTLMIGDSVLTSTINGNDIFFAKFNTSGNALWAKSINGYGGYTDDNGSGITTDINGNVYITGYYSSMYISFDSTSFINSGDYDIFITKYDSSGNMLWSRVAFGINGDYSNNIVTDNFGNVYITGYFWSPYIVFCSDTLTNTDTSICDNFIAKYSSSGNLLWAKSTTGIGRAIFYDIVTDAIGNIYITGFFSSPVEFDNITLTSSSGIFIAKYNSFGNVLWVKTADGGTSSNYSTGITNNQNGDIYISGNFYNSEASVIFGNDTLINHIYPDFVQSYTDIFLAKLHDTGNNFETPYFSNSVKVYPNPTSEKIIISGLTHFDQIQVISSTGQLFTSTVLHGQERVSITLPAGGLYFLRIISGKEVITRKVLVIKE